MDGVQIFHIDVIQLMPLSKYRMYLIPNLGFVCKMKRLNALGTCFKR